MRAGVFCLFVFICFAHRASLSSLHTAARQSLLHVIIRLTRAEKVPTLWSGQIHAE